MLFCIILLNVVVLGTDYVKVFEDTPTLYAKKCSTKNLVFSNL